MRSVPVNMDLNNYSNYLQDKLPQFSTFTKQYGKSTFTTLFVLVIVPFTENELSQLSSYSH